MDAQTPAPAPAPAPTPTPKRRGYTNAKANWRGKTKMERWYYTRLCALKHQGAYSGALVTPALYPKEEDFPYVATELESFAKIALEEAHNEAATLRWSVENEIWDFGEEEVVVDEMGQLVQLMEQVSIGDTAQKGEAGDVKQRRTEPRGAAKGILKASGSKAGKSVSWRAELEDVSPLPELQEPR